MWHDKYLKRLANVYLDKYEQDGYELAKQWYDGFLPLELRKAVKPHVAEEVRRRRSNKK